MATTYHTRVPRDFAGGEQTEGLCGALIPDEAANEAAERRCELCDDIKDRAWLHLSREVLNEMRRKQRARIERRVA